MPRPVGDVQQTQLYLPCHTPAQDQWAATTSCRKDLWAETPPNAPSFRASHVPRSHKCGLGRNRKNSYPRYEPGSQQQPDKRQRRKTQGFDSVCFFLLVEFAPQSCHWRAASFCVCFPVGLAGKRRPKERKIKKPRALILETSGFLYVLNFSGEFGFVCPSCQYSQCFSLKYMGAGNIY